MHLQELGHKEDIWMNASAEVKQYNQILLVPNETVICLSEE